MTARDAVECPHCYDPMPFVADGTSQTVQCAECKRFYWVTFDVTITEMEPPDWREVEGDLRYHERN